jgi:membrane protein
MIKNKISDYLGLFKESYKIFGENHPVKFASAIAYFSLFALPSIFVIIVFFLSIFFPEERILSELQERLRHVVGQDGAEILVFITQKYSEKAAESIATIAFYTLVVFWLSTQLFRLFQNSLNDLWRVKPVHDNFWKKLWIHRGVTFVLVITTGLLFYSSLAIEWGLEQILDLFISDLDQIEGSIHLIVNIITAIFVFLWFSVLYKVLPVVEIQWEPTFVGAAVTTALFYLGIFLIWYLVIERDLEEIYGFVAPIIMVALWVFYSSLVFLYGASFTKIYAKKRGKQISPEENAFKYRVVKDEKFDD